MTAARFQLPELTPPTPLELKEQIQRDYQRNLHRLGAGDVDQSALERLVVSDLDLVDAYERNALPPPPKKPRKDRTEEETPTEIRDFLENHSLSLHRSRSRAVVRNAFLDSRPRRPKAVACFARIRQILTPRGDIQAAARQGKDLRDVTEEYQCPDLARAFLDAWSDCLLGRGVFRGRSPRDSARIIASIAENICDASTGRLGPWWVK